MIDGLLKRYLAKGMGEFDFLIILLIGIVVFAMIYGIDFLYKKLKKKTK